MRILFVGINYWPEETGIAPFSTGRAEYLAARGHEVTFCTTFPYYPAWKLAREHRRSLISREVRRGVTILRTRIYVPSRPNSFKRLFHEGSFVAASLSRMLARRRPDVIFVVSPPLGLAAAGLLFSKLWNVPYLFHVADLQPDAAVDLGMLQAGRLVNLLYRFESTAYAGSGVVSTLTPAMRSRIVAKGIATDKVVLFQDWTDPRLFDIPASGGEDFRRAFGLEGKFLVTHAGNMGVKQGLEVVLEAAELSSRDPHIAYVLVGDGSMRKPLEQRARERALGNVHFIALQPAEVFHNLLAASDLAVVTQQRSVADIVFPSKVLTLLASARPVVASLNESSEVARVLREAGAGVVVEPETPSALFESVTALRADAGRRAAMSARGRLYARQQWDRDQILARMEGQLQALWQRSSRGGGVTREAASILSTAK